MPQPDFRGARGSNAGDDFHELWALRQALALLDSETDLKGITVEGLGLKDETHATPESWDGVDCALYFGGDTLASAVRIDLIQFKYSAANPGEAWTIARLCENTAKKTNNSVLRRLANAFQAARGIRGGSPAGIRVHLVSNQPIDPTTTTLFRAVAEGTVGGSWEDERKTKKASGLNVADFRQFAEAAEWTTDYSRFEVEEHVLRTVAAWTQGDARSVLNDLLSFMRRMMMPESRGKVITKETLYTQFNFSDSRAIFPCPPELTPVKRVIHRAGSSLVVSSMRDGNQYVCMHGPAGCGKTTALQEIEAQLPAGSQMLVFDCYGAGRYLDSDAYRHRPKDAFLQLCNQLAARLRVPLLLTRSDAIDYARSFHSRLVKAAEVLKASTPGAWLLVAVDAADNSITAAERMVPPERSFVRDFVSLGGLPENVRLLVSARSGRLPRLSVPDHFKRIEIQGFTRDETAQHVRSTWGDAPDSWIDDFQHFSRGNPRVQRYALGHANDRPQDSLNVLRPGGKILDDVFRVQLDEARKKSGNIQSLDSFCAALTVLPHPAPFSELSAISDLTMAELADVCSDLAPGIRITNDGVGFSDEDFEEFIRGSGLAGQRMAQIRAADRFTARHQFDPYAATHLAPALYAAGRGREVIELVEREPHAAAVVDPILRREVGFQRLQIAMRVSSELNDPAAMLRTILVGAEAMRSADAVVELIVKNPDLAAAFMREGAVRTLLRDARQINNHGRLLFHLVLEDARTGNHIGARATERQLNAWLERRRTEIVKKERPRISTSDDWLITEGDLAALVEAALLVGGLSAAIATLNRAKSSQFRLRAASIIVQRLICSGRGDVVERCLSDPQIKDPWSLFLQVPLALAGRTIDVSRLETALRQIRRRGWSRLEKARNSWGDDFPSFWLNTVLTGCEILVARGGDPKSVIPILTGFCDEALRKIDNLYPSQTALLDIQMRALALLLRLQGLALTTDKFLITPAAQSPGSQNRVSYHESQHREQIRRFVSTLIPLYDGRARLLAGGVSRSEVSAVLETTGTTLGDYTFSRMHDAFEMRRKAALAVAYLRCIPSLSSSEILARCLNVFGERPGHFGADELTVFPIFASDPALHDSILKILSRRVAVITAAKTLASEKIDAILSIARFVTDISRPEAAAHFSEAHKMTEEIDVEALHQLRAISSLASCASPALAPSQCREACRDLNAIVTDASVRLSNQEGFPWEDIVEALVKLDLPAAFACVSRWQDSNSQDLDSTLPTLLGAAMEEGRLGVETAIALLPLLRYVPSTLLRKIASHFEKSSDQEVLRVGSEFARDVLLSSAAAADPELTEELMQHLVAKRGSSPWLEAWAQTAAFLAGESKRSGRRGAISNRERLKASDLPAAGLHFTTSEEIINAVKNEMGRKTPQFVPTSDILDRVRVAVPAGDRALHLDALASIRSTEISEYEIAEAIHRALEDPDWNEMASVRQWCSVRLSDVIVDLLPGFAHGFGYGGRPPLPRLLEILATLGKDVPKVLARAIGAHVADLSAAIVYELVRFMAQHMEPEHAANALIKYLERVRRRIPADDLDEIPLNHVPTEGSIAIARLLFALMSDCDTRLRWRAAHVVRRLATFRLRQPLYAWMDLYDTTSEPAFRAANEPFYWLAARLWFVIVLNRVAYETPDVIGDRASVLVSVATDQSLPHVLMRAFAKDAALRLLESGHIRLTAKARKALVAANETPLKRAAKKYRRAGHALETEPERQRKFDFDHMDTVPYWYDRAIDVFADVTQEEFLDAAEGWIVKKWKVPAASSRWDLQPRRYRFSERNWRESSNGHGSEPTLERYTTYLERHAMFCAVGELMESRRLVELTQDREDRFDVWLRRRGLSSPPYWLADLRAAKPLERQFWFEPADFSAWLQGPLETEYLCELGLSTGEEMITVRAWHNTGSSQFSSEVKVSSALVEPTTASALMRALQTVADPYDYALPDESQNDEIDAPPYRLKGWLQRNDSNSGIDTKDPLGRTIDGIRYRPGADIATGFSETVSCGRVFWLGAGESVQFERLAWSDKRRDDNADRRTRLESEGERLYVSANALHSYMVRTGLDLIVAIKCIREEGDGGYEREGSKKEKSRTAKIVILRKDGTIEGCEGRLGTWQASRRGA